MFIGGCNGEMVGLKRLIKGKLNWGGGIICGLNGRGSVSMEGSGKGG